MRPVRHDNSLQIVNHLALVEHRVNDMREGFA
jgi:hypothetical protein